MNKPTIVYGASDDLIEIEGPVSEEFGAYDSDPCYLGFSNGVVLRVEYDNEGMWRVRPCAGHDKVTLIAARGEDADPFRDGDGCPGHSDKAVIAEAVSWVVLGAEWAKS